MFHCQGKEKWMKHCEIMILVSSCLVGQEVILVRGLNHRKLVSGCLEFQYWAGTVNRNKILSDRSSEYR